MLLARSPSTCSLEVESREMGFSRIVAFSIHMMNFVILSLEMWFPIRLRLLYSVCVFIY